LAVGSHCEHQNSKVPDGACSVPMEDSGANGDFDLEHAERMLHFAFAAYHSASSVEAWNCGVHCSAVSGLEMIHYIYHKSSDLAAFVAYDSTEDAILVSFRGSNGVSISNWVANLKYTKTSPWLQFPDVGVHHGFYDAWSDLKLDVITANNIIQEHHPTKRMEITGHSLGAAIAIDAAFELKVEIGYDTSVVNFGQPRAGDKNFAKAVASQGISVFRVTHANDLVPHVPPRVFGFYHASQEVHFPGSGASSYKECDGGEDPTCSDACSPLHCTSVDDHLHYLGFTANQAQSLVV